MGYPRTPYPSSLRASEFDAETSFCKAAPQIAATPAAPARNLQTENSTSRLAYRTGPTSAPTAAPAPNPHPATVWGEPKSAHSTTRSSAPATQPEARYPERATKPKPANS